MSNYRVVELSPSQYVIEVKRVIKKWYWFGGKVEEWHLANVEGTYYGDKYKYSFRGRMVIPVLKPFSYPRQANLKIKEFERDSILQSLPKVAS